jgi:hypothetical protein
VRIVENQKYIQRRAQIGRYAFFGGLGVLLVGLIISLNPAWISLFPLTFVCLIVGALLSQVGGYYTRRFDRGVLPHLALSKALKGFDDRYTLVHYGTPASHVLLAPDTVYVFVTKAQAGVITYADGRWRNPTGLRRLLTWMAEEGLGKPTRDAAIEVARFQRFATTHLPDRSIEPQPIIVFLHPNAQLDVTDSPVPAVHVKKLKDWLRARPRGSLSREDHAALTRLLEPATTA